MAAADNPGETVAGTPELLEDILLRIDLRTLLLSQRVNKTFEATIAGSTKLQQKLFFQPMPANVKFPCTEIQCRDRACDRYFKNLTDPHRPRPEVLRPLGHANPLFEKYVYLYTSGHSNHPVDARFSVSSDYAFGGGYLDPCMHLGPRTGTKKELVQASWRRMFAYQPVMPVNFMALRGGLPQVFAEGSGGPRTAEDLVKQYYYLRRKETSSPEGLWYR